MIKGSLMANYMKNLNKEIVIGGGLTILLVHGAGCGYEKVLNKNNENIKEEGNNG